MQIPVTEEVPHDTLPGVFVERSNSLWEMVRRVRDVMVETGGVLRRGGYRCLGGLVVECARRSKGQGNEGISASIFIYHVFLLCPLKGFPFSYSGPEIYLALRLILH